VVNAYILEVAKVHPATPLFERLGQRVDEAPDDAVKLGHEDGVSAGIETDLREKSERLGLHVIGLERFFGVWPLHRAFV